MFKRYIWKCLADGSYDNRTPRRTVLIYSFVPASGIMAGWQPLGLAMSNEQIALSWLGQQSSCPTLLVAEMYPRNGMPRTVMPVCRLLSRSVAERGGVGACKPVSCALPCPAYLITSWPSAPCIVHIYRKPLSLWGLSLFIFRWLKAYDGGSMRADGLL